MSALLDDVSRIIASSMPRRQAFRLIGTALGGALAASLGLGGGSRGWSAPAGGQQEGATACGPGTFACGHKCCTTGKQTCCGSGSTAVCCNSGTTCCSSAAGSLCCSSGTKCCTGASGIKCCSTGQTCCNGVCCGGGTPVCCGMPSHAICCDSGDVCCSGKCCDKGPSKSNPCYQAKCEPVS